MLSESQNNRPRQIVKTITSNTFTQAKIAIVERHYSAQCSYKCAVAAHDDGHPYAIFWKREIERMDEALAELECGGVLA